ncbi:hypothetical protein TNCV_4677091 [Trichonephila clavipes]|nr:hypothetical protein TNCV_4677091 [Trichonephila clavipes]
MDDDFACYGFKDIVHMLKNNRSGLRDRYYRMHRADVSLVAPQNPLNLTHYLVLIISATFCALWMHLEWCLMKFEVWTDLSFSVQSPYFSLLLFQIPLDQETLHQVNLIFPHKNVTGQVLIFKQLSQGNVPAVQKMSREPLR